MAGEPNPFVTWSPSQLAFALGYRVDIRIERNGERVMFLIGPTGNDHPTHYMRAYHSLSRLARWRGLDPHAAPIKTPRALLNGEER